MLLIPVCFCSYSANAVSISSLTASFHNLRNNIQCISFNRCITLCTKLSLKNIRPHFTLCVTKQSNVLYHQSSIAGSIGSNNNINVKKPNSLKQCVRTTCFSHKTKTAKIKKVVSPSITSPKCQCDAK